MKSTGIVRKVDDLGRIVLPKELRKILDIEERDPLEIYVDSNTIVLQKYEPSCIFCGSVEQIAAYMGRTICADCASKLGSSLPETKSAAQIKASVPEESV